MNPLGRVFSRISCPALSPCPLSHGGERGFRPAFPSACLGRPGRCFPSPNPRHSLGRGSRPPPWGKGEGRGPSPPAPSPTEGRGGFGRRSLPPAWGVPADVSLPATCETVSAAVPFPLPGGRVREGGEPSPPAPSPTEGRGGLSAAVPFPLPGGRVREGGRQRSGECVRTVPFGRLGVSERLCPSSWAGSNVSPEETAADSEPAPGGGRRARRQAGR